MEPNPCDWGEGVNAVLFRNDKFGTGIDNELTEGSYPKSGHNRKMQFWMIIARRSSEGVSSYTGYAYALGLISSVIIGFVWLTVGLVRPQASNTYRTHHLRLAERSLPCTVKSQMQGRSSNVVVTNVT
ncbi:uncharacterized protein ACA1_293580 [Acanthamoeba castellanii str. Neff]|uniref:Uncharacterized protein n=1 Tax=Acanthamoeba castellanii (strain ATCC 30010 / Neff) TaxID=1257118 RepID=L8HJM1_ACACF|nr:uncharacterized protein ACA1_293580 [Acanthamoeba castellanii str. Neff]ELR25407.1 hypothetical protein ACA1_293580 [Acanthamoeba castellanii str. Neff]